MLQPFNQHVNFQNISQLWQQQRERIRNHQTIQVVINEPKVPSFQLKIKTRKFMHEDTKSVFLLEIQNNMLHFFLIKVVKRKRRTLEEKLDIIFPLINASFCHF